MSDIETGKIVRLIGDRGFGFIEASDQSGEVFFHASNCIKEVAFETLSVGMKVQYERTHDAKGYRAMEVTPI